MSGSMLALLGSLPYKGPIELQHREPGAAGRYFAVAVEAAFVHLGALAHICGFGDGGCRFIRAKAIYLSVSLCVCIYVLYIRIHSHVVLQSFGGIAGWQGLLLGKSFLSFGITGGMSAEMS